MRDNNANEVLYTWPPRGKRYHLAAGRAGKTACGRTFSERAGWLADYFTPPDRDLCRRCVATQCEALGLPDPLG